MPECSLTTAVVRPIRYVEPLAAFTALRGGALSVLFESAGEGPDTGRYSVIAVDPVEVVRASWEHAFGRLQAFWDSRPGYIRPAGWPIGPGLYGSLGYELRRALERVPSRHPPVAFPDDLLVGLFDTVVVFDLVDRRAAILAVDLSSDRPPAGDRVAELVGRLAKAGAMPALNWTAQAHWTADHSEAAYAAQVTRALDYIRAGDIYQANFTQRWQALRPAGLSPLDLYRRLRQLSPAPYAGLIEAANGDAIVAASPERFLALSPDGRIDTRPIKGTRPRGATPSEDAARSAALRSSTKDHAENLMIVDLLRNDIGRVAQTGSVAVPELNALYSFASVHHLVSTVTGQLRPGLGPIDLIRACFPGGSVTGAPKIRAMEIIDELEAGRRGAYCGAIGWIGLDGAMELSIAIRTLTLTADRVIAQAGGGIVSDSDPIGEYHEALAKARALLGTLDPAYR
jgi:para-aminobenzoate synthetase component 1